MISSLLGTLLLIVAVSGCTNTTGNIAANQQNCIDIQEPYDDCKNIQVAYEEEDCDTVSYTEQECEYKELTYKSTDDQMQEDVKCVENHKDCIKEGWFGTCAEWKTVCDKYTRYTSFEITNLDSEKGTWYFDWMRNCLANQPLCAVDEPTRYYGKEYLYVKFTHMPEKQICRDVIKYKTVCNSVTKYRPEEMCETKYNIVQECD